MLTLAKVMQFWWDEEPHAWAPRTLESYRTAREALVADLGGVDVATLTARVVLDTLTAYHAQGCSIGYIRIRFGVLKRALDVAVLRGALTTNPAIGVWAIFRRMVPAGDDGIRILEPGTAAPLVAEITRTHPQIGWLATTYQQTGMRLCEALGLQEPDVDFAGHCVTVRRQWQGAGRCREMTKGKRRRILDLSGRLEDTLRAAIDEARAVVARRQLSVEPRWIFRSNRGTPWSPGYVCKIFRDAGAVLALDRYGSHAFRHAVCTTLAYDGVPLADLRDWMGHANIGTTERYLHVRRRSQRDRLGGLDRM